MVKEGNKLIFGHAELEVSLGYSGSHVKRY